MNIEINDQFTEIVLEKIEEAGGSISEYDLLKKLHSDPRLTLSDPFHDKYSMYCAHFQLFHTLYKLRDDLLNTKKALIDINVVRIVMQPYRDGITSLHCYDPMREYYANLSNMEATTVEEVDSLIASFWKRFLACGDRQQALAVLGLKDPVDEETIKKQYHRLVILHHPDRGGDHGEMQSINAAKTKLANKNSS